MRPRRKACCTLLLLLMTPVPPAAAQAQQPSAGAGCWVRGERSDLELRASPYDSATVELDAGVVKVCYSRPRKLGRPIMGRLVPFGEAWRLGANEATAIHVPVRATVAGVVVEPGWYSLYTVPDEHEWRIVVNRQARRWGIPIDEAVRADDVGSGIVKTHQGSAAVELLTMRFQRTDRTATDLVVEWDRTGVRIPIVLQPAARDRGRS